MRNKFSIEMCSDLDFEGMVIDISYNMDVISSINYDKGIDKMEIQILSREEDAPKLIFPLEDFMLVLEEAKSIAIRCAKEEEHRNQ